MIHSHTFSLQALKLEKDIVDDRLVKISHRRDNVAFGDANDIDDDDNVDKVLSISRTRSGRMSRPPTQPDDEYQYRITPSASTMLSTQNTVSDVTAPSVISKENVVSLQASLPPKPKRKLSVPPRYRCRVCHKTYLGKKIYSLTNNISLFIFKCLLTVP